MSRFVKYPKGLGEPEIITVNNPAAGADFSYVLPANFAYEPLAIRGTFVTSAAVANRNPRFVYRDAGGVTLSITYNNANHAANTTIAYYAGAGQGQVMPVFNGVVWFPLPVGVILPAGAVIASSTIAIDAADQWSNLRITLRKYRL